WRLQVGAPGIAARQDAQIGLTQVPAHPIRATLAGVPRKRVLRPLDQQVSRLDPGPTRVSERHLQRDVTRVPPMRGGRYARRGTRCQVWKNRHVLRQTEALVRGV